MRDLTLISGTDIDRFDNIIFDTITFDFCRAMTITN